MIPIMKPTLPAFEDVRADFEAIMTTGQLTLGPYVKAFEAKVAQYLGVKHVIGNPSASMGLMILASVLPRGSEVILPSYTFSATHQALRWCGLHAVPVDCDDRCLVDVGEVKKAVTSKTSAILAVHMFGHPADVEGLAAVARASKLRLFFDAAHAFGSEWKGRKVGGFGDAEVFSLGPTKTMPTGEGGLITTNDDALAARLRLASNHGHPAGSLDSFVDGMNARLQELNAAIGLKLLDSLDGWIRRRNELADLYDRGLGPLPGVTLITRAADVLSTIKDYSIFIDPAAFGRSRDDLASFLSERGIMTKTYYWPPVHLLSYAREEFAGIVLPRTEALASRTLSLPLYSHMPTDEVEQVIAAVRAACRT